MSSLAQPTPLEIRRSRQLVSDLREEMGDGELDFASYMQRALYAPGLGYYMADSDKFGAAGDFVTAPEVSPLFAAAIANTALGVLEETGGGILEVGAGSGRLCSDLLQCLASSRHLPARYCILEISPALRARQRSLLRRECPGLFDLVEWVDAVPSGFCGVILANEVADALGVVRFRIGHGGVEEICSAFVDDVLQDVSRPASADLCDRVQALESALGRRFAVGYESEVCAALEDWCRQLVSGLQAGAMFVFDYGYPRDEYYLAERSTGTLVCHYRHRAHFDPYWYPGVQDISAFVDFTRLAEAACATGLDFEGYTSQARFLLENEALGGLAPAEQFDADAVQVLNAFKTLIMPGEMGERFRVAAFSRRLSEAVRGFDAPLNHRL